MDVQVLQDRPGLMEQAEECSTVKCELQGLSTQLGRYKDFFTYKMLLICLPIA